MKDIKLKVGGKDEFKTHKATIERAKAAVQAARPPKEGKTPRMSGTAPLRKAA